jgi:hypothetical protein
LNTQTVCLEHLISPPAMYQNKETVIKSFFVKFFELEKWRLVYNVLMFSFSFSRAEILDHVLNAHGHQLRL